MSRVVGALASVLASIAMLGGTHGDPEENRPNGAVMLLFAIVGPVAAGFVRMAGSRSREYQADSSAAELTGDPLALASAVAGEERASGG